MGFPRPRKLRNQGRSQRLFFVRLAAPHHFCGRELGAVGAKLQLRPQARGREQLIRLQVEVEGEDLSAGRLGPDRPEADGLPALPVAIGMELHPLE